MSTGAGDDYAGDLQNQSSIQSGHDVEPADPGRTDHSARREQPLAPERVDNSELPKPFRMEDGCAQSVEDAAETYLKIQKTNWNTDGVTSKYERHRYEIYTKIQQADRHFQHNYDNLTTALLTRRLSPLDDDGNWLTPWECDELLHGGDIHRSVRRALDYQLDGYDYEWVAVTAPTTSAGTPHEHIYIWIDDPNNTVGADHFSSALEKHLKHCENAYPEDHEYQDDGSHGAITYQHDPDQIGVTAIQFSAVTEQCPTYQECGIAYRTTQGAQYLASQLAHLPTANFYDHDEETPPQALFEGAALSWATDHYWFRTSRGVPGLEH